MAIGIETDIIYQGDCKEILKKFPPESVDLIYVDPPFFSNKSYEVVWGNGAELKAFEDRWKGGIMNYVEWMKERIEPMFTVLKKSGLFVIHLDWHANSYVRVFILDKLFGENNFRNEIVWHYRTGNVSEKQLQRKHDTLLVYSKSNKWTFNPIEVKEYYSQMYGPNFKPSFKGRKSGKDEHGDFRISFIDDVWDISAVFTLSKEHLDYPTQKPEKLLERIIRMFSNENDLVLDPMMGGGTTLAVAQKLKRKWIGIDISPLACDMTAKRLRKLGVKEVTVVSGMINEKELRNFKPFEFQKWVCDKIFGRISDRKSSDMGIDGYTFEGIPIQVKQSDGVGRNIVDNFETAIRRVRKNKGFIVAFSFGKGANEEVARVKIDEGIEIKLITVKELLEGQDKEDLLEFKGH